MVGQLCTQTCIQQGKWDNFCFAYIPKELILSEFIAIINDISLTGCAWLHVGPRLEYWEGVVVFLCLYVQHQWFCVSQHRIVHNSLNNSNFTKACAHLCSALKAVQLLCKNFLHRSQTPKIQDYIFDYVKKIFIY